MLRDRYGEVIPAISRVEEAVIIPLELTRKEDDQTSRDGADAVLAVTDHLLHLNHISILFHI